MKKLMIVAAAVLAAGVTFGGDSIESENIVGYAKKTLAAKNKFIGAQFNRVDNEDITLADFALDENYNADYDYVKMYSADLTTMSAYVYYSQAYIDDMKDPDDDENPFNTATPGWYDKNDDALSAKYDSVKVGFGKSFIMYCKSAGDGVTTSGEVATSDVTFKVAAKNTFLANPTPVDRVFSDITVAGSYDADYDYVKIYSADLSTMTALVYYSQAYIDDMKDPDDDENPFNTATPGWYDKNDDMLSTKYDSTPVKAGEGFIVYSKNGNATFTFKGAKAE